MRLAKVYGKPHLRGRTDNKLQRAHVLTRPDLGQEMRLAKPTSWNTAPCDNLLNGDVGGDTDNIYQTIPDGDRIRVVHGAIDGRKGEARKLRADGLDDCTAAYLGYVGFGDCRGAYAPDERVAVEEVAVSGGAGCLGELPWVGKSRRGELPWGKVRWEGEGEGEGKGGKNGE